MSVIRKKPDHQVWDRVLAGDVSAYQLVVESHQSSVSAVAYAIVGDFPSSQDIAQETFWVAWTQRNTLRDVRKLGSWLCGIARNLAKQLRKKIRKQAKTSGGNLPYEPEASILDPAQHSIAEEEQQLVWSTLEKIPENYREVLTLYYRQGKSVAEVALALDITEEATRQRLSRGRSMLRGRVSQLIEGVLDRSKPDASFAAKVIAGLIGAGLATKAGTAAASTATLAKTASSATATFAAAKGIVATGAATGLIGGLFGAVGGLAGSYLGTWIPAQLAQTETERQFLQQEGRIVFGMTIVFTVAILALSLTFAFIGFNGWIYAGILLSLMLGFMIPIIFRTIRISKMAASLREHVTPEEDPNQSGLAAYATKLGMNNVRRGRCYTSDLELFGYPLVDIQIADFALVGNPGMGQPKNHKHAKGWIAIGDRATGLLFAAGGFAKGFVAIGGVSVGAISLGGLSVGLISMGGLAIGLLLAIGGGAIGYDAAGGGALGWHSAAGGCAIAMEVAAGGLAMASDYAVGGKAIAAEANTPAAKAVANSETLMPYVELVSKHLYWFVGITTALAILPSFLMRFAYTTEEEPVKKGKSDP